MMPFLIFRAGTFRVKVHRHSPPWYLSSMFMLHDCCFTAAHVCHEGCLCAAPREAGGVEACLHPAQSVSFMPTERPPQPTALSRHTVCGGQGLAVCKYRYTLTCPCCSFRRSCRGGGPGAPGAGRVCLSAPRAGRQGNRAEQLQGRRRRRNWGSEKLNSAAILGSGRIGFWFWTCGLSASQAGPGSPPPSARRRRRADPSRPPPGHRSHRNKVVRAEWNRERGVGGQVREGSAREGGVFRKKRGGVQAPLQPGGACAGGVVGAEAAKE